MTGRRTVGEVLREHGAAAGVALGMLALVVAGVRLASRGRDGGRQKPPVRMITAEIKTMPPPRAPPPPPREEPKEDEPREEPPQRLVEVKATDVPPPEGPKAGPASGQVAMAGDATGPGDAFGLEGSRSTRSLVGSGGVGGVGGGGIGEGGDPNARFGWYFRQIASSIQGAFQRSRKLQFAEARVELRIWVSPSGEVERVQLLRSTGDEELDRAIEGVRGVKLRDALPPDLPNPAVYRFTARKVR